MSYIVCPAPPFALQGRVLGGAVTDPCTVDGVLQFGTASQEVRYLTYCLTYRAVPTA